ncbi:MAG: hypothetical protein ACRDF1_03845 [bacterium]
MSQQKRSKLPPQGRGRRRATRNPFLWGIPVMLLLIIGVAVAWLVSRSGGPSPSATALPGPAGGRDVAQDVNTLIGQAAPSFTLSTAEGQTYEIRPGQGRSTVLIFHMGVT